MPLSTNGAGQGRKHQSVVSANTYITPLGPASRFCQPAGKGLRSRRPFDVGAWPPQGSVRISLDVALPSIRMGPPRETERHAIHCASKHGQRRRDVAVLGRAPVEKVPASARRDRCEVAPGPPYRDMDQRPTPGWRIGGPPRLALVRPIARGQRLRNQSTSRSEKRSRRL